MIDTRSPILKMGLSLRRNKMIFDRIYLYGVTDEQFCPGTIVCHAESRLRHVVWSHIQSFRRIRKASRVECASGQVDTRRKSGSRRQGLVGQGPQGFFALQTPPTTEKLQSYWRHISEIVTSSQGEFTAAAEGHFKQSQHDVQTFVDSLAKNAPAGSEAIVSAWKSAIGTASETANSAYDAAKKATQQVIEIAENNVSAASSASTALAKIAVTRTTATTEKK